MLSNASRFWKIICLVGVLAVGLFHAGAASAATYYVDTGGSDGALGSPGSPWRTIGHAITRVNSGDIIYVNNGTYRPTNTLQIVDNNVSLIANGNSVIIEGSSLTGGAPIFAIWKNNNITVDGFQITGGPYRAFNITGNGVTIKNCKIYNNKYEIGIFGWFASDLVLSGNEIYGNGTNGGGGGNGKTHGVYLATECNNVVVENNYIHDNGEAGLHINGNSPKNDPIFPSDGINRNSVVRNNIFANNWSIGGDFFNTHDSFLYNNLFINDHWDLCSNPPFATNANNNAVYNNTFVLSGGSVALRLFGPNTGINPDFAWANDNVVFNNVIITTNSSRAIINDGQNNQINHNYIATYSQNLVQNLFADPANADYHITAGSTAHDAGQSSFQGISAPGTDMEGTPRPSGNGVDYGAYEIADGEVGCAPLPAPQGLGGSESVATCVGLNWVAGTDPDLAGYVVYWGTQSVAQGQVTQYANQLDVGSMTTADVCGLVNGTWYFSVQAYNSCGEFSNYASEITVETNLSDETGPTILAAFPADGEADVPLDSRLFLMISDAQSGVDDLSITATINGSPAVGYSFTGSPSSYGVVVEPDGFLPPFSAVVVNVTAQDRAFPSNSSSLVWAFTTINEPPAPPLLVDVQGSSDGCLDILWNPSPEPDVIGYTIYHGTSSVSSGQVAMYEDSVEVGTISGRTLCGLASGTYYVAIRARNSGGLYSDYSIEAATNVSNGVTQGPTPPQQLQLEETAKGCVTASWIPNSEPDIAGYVVYYASLSVAQGEAVAYEDSLDVGLNASMEICLFPPNSTQYFTVRAYNNSGIWSGYSVEKSIKVIGTDSSGPGIVLAYPPDGSTDIDLDKNIFVLLTDDQTGVDTTSISVEINGKAPRKITHSGTINNRVLVCEPQGTLPPNRQINVTVVASDLAANNSTGGGSFTTVNPLPTAPVGVSVIGGSVGCADVAWTTNPESDITGYTIYYGLSSVAQGQASNYDDSLVVGSVISASICGLVDGTYYFAIRANNSGGYGSPYSVEVADLVTNGSAQGPLPPQQVQASETQPGCVDVGWQPNSEPDIAGYVVYWGPLSVAQGDVSQYPDSIVVGNLSHEECGFVQSTRYFTVRAFNASGIYSGYSVERRVDVVGPDQTPPSIMIVSPDDGAINVPQNTQVFFTLSDGQTGVDTNSVSVTINGAVPASMSFTGDPSSYAVICQTAGNFAPDSPVTVVVGASDLASPSNTANHTWSFVTGNENDNDPPTFVSHSPADGAQWVGANATIEVTMRDNTGIDLSRTVFLVNGSTVGTTVSIAPNGDLTLSYRDPAGLAVGTVNIRVLAADLSHNQNELQFSFTTSTSQASAQSGPVIVPDGYWKDDPARPLQVSNIPLGWTVRIFDPTGKEVRSHLNNQSDGAVWQWDFENGSGRRVARAIYLVRVVDGDGLVRRSGKFIVQLDP